jgi:hypothetical protein
MIAIIVEVEGLCDSAKRSWVVLAQNQCVRYAIDVIAPAVCCSSNL